MHPRKYFDILLENLCKGMRCSFALGPVLVGHEIQRRLEVQRLVAHVKFKPRHCFVEQAVPCGRADSGLIVQEFFQLVRQLVRLHRAHPVKHRFIAGKVRVGIKQRRQMRVV